MKRQNKQKNSDPLLSVLGELKSIIPELSDETENDRGASNQSEIVDIITFCENPRLLALPDSNLHLFPAQRVILKSFYMGSIGNENLKLSQEDWEWLYETQKKQNYGQDGEDFYGNNLDEVIEKIKQRENGTTQVTFSLLQLVLGRRSGKTLLASIITAYEVYKLLSINNGDPHGYYGLPQGDIISILNVALSQDQAGLLFTAIAARLRNSPFFKDKIDGDSASEIRLFTKKDMEMRSQATSLKVKGSVELICGHSNPDSLRGRNAIMILFDEIAFFEEKGKVSGTKFFADLKPSVARFYKHNAAKIVMISSPNSRNGIFFDMFSNSKNEKATLSFQLPTWLVNLDLRYENDEIQSDKRRDPENFLKEYGAQFGSSRNFSKFFEEALVDRCVSSTAERHVRPNPKMNYYLHIDPANGGNNYAGVLVAKERYSNVLGKKRNRCHLAGIWIWRPGELGLQFNQIDKEVLAICRLFRPLAVTYDAYNSIQSLQFLRSNGVPASELPYNRSNKIKLYQNLYDMMSYEYGPELILYNDGGDAHLLIQELKGLRKKNTQRGFTIVPDKEGEVKSDDISDCLAGACANANDGIRMSLPEPITVKSGIF